MIVSLGALPPCLASSSSWSIKSRGSNAILLPPANADPACDVDALTDCDELGECLLDVGAEVLLPLSPQASPSSSSAAEEDAATRRRWSPPEDMAG